MSFAKRNLIARYDSEQGTLKETWTINAPGRMAGLPNQTVAVISDGKVYALHANARTLLLHDHLDQPSGIAVAADGTLYVANGGALQNVSVFAADGTYLRSIGKAGGRPRVGRFDRNGMLEPGGIALDANNKLWVAETLDYPKRQSVWNAQTGAFEKEFFGAAGYNGWAYMDPKHPDELYCQNVLWKINLDTGACTPYSTIYRPTNPNMVGEVSPEGNVGHLRVFTAKNGHQYAWGQGEGYGGFLFLRDGDVFKPVAGAITIGRRFPALADTAKYPGGIGFWQDLNDDQMVQGNEVTRMDMLCPQFQLTENMFDYVDGDLNIWNCAKSNRTDTLFYNTLLRPVRIEANGRPVYDVTKAETLPVRTVNTGADSMWLDNQDDSIYTLTGGETNPGFAHWTRNGKLLWGYHVLSWKESTNLSLVTPGKLHGLASYLGMAGEFTGAATYFNPYHIFTRDGVYVAMVMRDSRDGKGLGADVTSTEVCAGQLVKPDGMNRYFLIAGAADGRVTEILGLNTVRHLAGGEYVITDEMAKTVTKAQSDYARSIQASSHFDIVRGLDALGTAKSIANNYSSERNFKVRAAYDEKNLYVKYEVTSPYDLVNDMRDPKLLFKGGNCLDIQLAANAAADAKRQTAVPGDLRMLISRQQGKPIAVIYRPKIARFSGHPIVLTSPANAESFDAIETTDRMTLDYQKTETGFTALVTIPCDVIGWHPQAGATMKIDLGYIFGNATGTQAALRAYWKNHSFAAGILNDVPTESRLEPQEWGTATIE